MSKRFEIHTRLVMRSGITFYGAHDTELDREVWLWRLFEFGDPDAKPAEELLNAEKAPLLGLNHPGIVTLHDIEADPDGVVALLEPAVGEPLDELMSKGPVEVAEFYQIAESCLEALSASAASGVPHGAIEPGLIFVARTEDGTVSASIVGFGIARFVMRMHESDHECTEALDVWMLGGIFHMLLSGTITEEGQVVRAPHEVRPEIPGAVSEWVMRLLVDDPALRPQTAAEALAQLRNAIAQPPHPVPDFQTQSQPMPPAQWPVGYDPNLHQPPMWHYPQVPVWHVPPPQWTQPYDPAVAAQHPQMWQQVPWYPGHVQMHPDPYQQQFAQQAAAPPPEVKVTVTPITLAPASNAPKPRQPVQPKRVNSTGAKPEATKKDVTPEKPKPSPGRWIGPAISLAATVAVIWFFRGFFLPLLLPKSWQERLGDSAPIQQSGKNPPPPAAPPPKSPAAK